MFSQLTPVTRNIILVNIIVYLASNLLYQGQLYGVLSAFYPESPNFHWWQIMTHMFMHAPFYGGYGLFHIVFNMMTLASFGPILEKILGEKRFTILYFASGLGAFLLFNAYDYFEVQKLTQELINLGINVEEVYKKSALSYHGDESIFNQPKALELGKILATPMLGASGAIFGVVAAFATLFPDAKIGILFIPVPIKVKYLLPIVIIGSIYLGINSENSSVAHFAHVGGAIVGYVLAKAWRKHINRFRIM